MAPLNATVVVQFKDYARCTSLYWAAHSSVTSGAETKSEL